MNAAEVDIAGVVGEQKFVIQPGKHKIIQAELEPGERTCHTALYFRKGETARPFFSSKWPVSRDARGLIFFFHDPGTKRLRFHSIRNFL